VFEDGEAGVDAALAGGFWTVGIGRANVGRAHIVLPDLASQSVADLLDTFNVVAQQSHG
jgi:beta-phosphoglucomutase